jgi:hypothetical protein
VLGVWVLVLLMLFLLVQLVSLVLIGARGDFVVDDGLRLRCRFRIPKPNPMRYGCEVTNEVNGVHTTI